jgi:antirestriction protein
MLKIYVANLGKYNEGHLVGEWVNLPCTEEEMQNLFVRIKLARFENGEYIEGYEENGSIYEEHAIHDFETDIEGLKVEEYSSISELNELAETIEDFEESETTALQAFLENGCDIEKAIEHVQDGDYRIYYDCEDMEDVAQEYADEVGLLDSVPENLRGYFDFASFGRDMGFEGTYIFIGNDCVELIY